jgi:hypothetical protein
MQRFAMRTAPGRFTRARRFRATRARSEKYDVFTRVDDFFRAIGVNS